MSNFQEYDITSLVVQSLEEYYINNVSIQSDESCDLPCLSQCCDCCGDDPGTPAVCDCPCCPNGTALQWQFTVSGDFGGGTGTVGDRYCECMSAHLAGQTVVLNKGDGCTWTATYGDSSYCGQILASLYCYGDYWEFSPNRGRSRYRLAVADFNCTGPNVFTYAGGGGRDGSCLQHPGTMTLTPVGTVSGSCNCGCSNVPNNLTLTYTLVASSGYCPPTGTMSFSSIGGGAWKNSDYGITLTCCSSEGKFYLTCEETDSKNTGQPSVCNRTTNRILMSKQSSDCTPFVLTGSGPFAVMCLTDTANYQCGYNLTIAA